MVAGRLRRMERHCGSSRGEVPPKLGPQTKHSTCKLLEKEKGSKQIIKKGGGSHKKEESKGNIVVVGKTTVAKLRCEKG